LILCLIVLILIHASFVNALACCVCKKGDAVTLQGDCSRCNKLCEQPPINSVIANCYENEECTGSFEYVTGAPTVPEFSAIGIVLVLLFLGIGYLIYKKKRRYRYY